MTDLSHLNALRLRLSHERNLRGVAKSEGERELRAVWIAQIEREIAGELAFLGIADEPEPEAMTNAELLAALQA